MNSSHHLEMQTSLNWPPDNTMISWPTSGWSPPGKSLSLAVPNSGLIVWSDLLKVWHSVSTSRSVYFSIVWVWNSLTQIDTVPVAIIYEVIWSPFCVIGKDSLQLHWQKTMFPGLGKFIYIYVYFWLKNKGVFQDAFATLFDFWDQWKEN